MGETRNPRDDPPRGRSWSTDRLHLARFERLAERLRARPEELLRLTRRLALRTIDDLRRSLERRGGDLVSPAALDHPGHDRD